VPLTTFSSLARGNISWCFWDPSNTNALSGHNVQFLKCFSWCVSVACTHETGQLPAPLSRPQTSVEARLHSDRDPNPGFLVVQPSRLPLQLRFPRNDAYLQPWRSLLPRIFIAVHSLVCFRLTACSWCLGNVLNRPAVTAAREWEIGSTNKPNLT
jgi:hypothetical protein